jgi:hypothetical protein
MHILSMRSLARGAYEKNREEIMLGDLSSLHLHLGSGILFEDAIGYRDGRNQCFES